MSSTTYFVLVNRRRLEAEVAPMIADVLTGNTAEALRILRARLPELELTKTIPPSRYYKVQSALDTLEGRLTEAFVNEITPTITDPAEAWKRNVDSLVRGGLAASLCIESPGDDLPSSIGFEFRFSALICTSSPTAKNASDHDDPALVRPAHAGIFDEEVFLTRPCVEAIVSETGPLVAATWDSNEDEETKTCLSRFQALFTAPLRNPDLAILRGYL